MAPDDPAARPLNGVIEGTGPMTAALRAAGVRFVLVDDGSPQAGRMPGCRVLIAEGGVTVYEVPLSVHDEGRAASRADEAHTDDAHDDRRR